MLLNPDYLIVILSYNHPDLTAKTVKSVIQTGFPMSQIILVHNGSEQKNINVLKADFLEIEHIITDTNKGYTAGANFGLKYGFLKMPNILFLTNDTEALHLPNNFPENFDLFSILISKRNSEFIDSIYGQVNLHTGSLTHVRALTDLKKEKHIKIYIPGTAFGITKNAFNTLNGFDESYHTYWDDVDLSLRAHQQNLRLGYAPIFHVKHKIGKTCHKHRFYTLYLFQRNKLRFLKRFSESKISYVVYYLEMFRLGFKIMLKPNRKTQINFWWKALRDQSI